MFGELNSTTEPRLWEEKDFQGQGIQLIDEPASFFRRDEILHAQVVGELIIQKVRGSDRFVSKKDPSLRGILFIKEPLDCDGRIYDDHRLSRIARTSAAASLLDNRFAFEG